MKKCARCGDGHDRKDSYCKPCRTLYAREWRLKNPEAQRAAKKRWEAEHPEEVKAQKRRSYQRDLERSREHQRRRRAEAPEVFAEYARTAKKRIAERGGYGYYRHGITIEQRAAFVESQNGVCPLCDKPLDDVEVHVDHDHETGMLRGLLCRTCNNRLGWYEQRARKVAEYLTGPHQAPAAVKLRRGPNRMTEA